MEIVKGKKLIFILLVLLVFVILLSLLVYCSVNELRYSLFQRDGYTQIEDQNNLTPKGEVHEYQQIYEGKTQKGPEKYIISDVKMQKAAFEAAKLHVEAGLLKNNRSIDKEVITDINETIQILEKLDNPKNARTEWELTEADRTHELTKMFMYNSMMVIVKFKLNYNLVANNFTVSDSNVSFLYFEEPLE